ncbi:MAG: hypothetical protein QG637_92, partial [Chloroflexota bacterium]|nr:hypothetical protein [Chloroflexota bacterium]
LTVIAAIWLAARLFAMPELLALLSLPTLFAASMLGVRWSFVVVLGETISLVALTRAGGGDNQAVVWVAVCGVWMTWTALLAIYRPIDGVVVWWQAYYRRAQGLLEEARDRQAALSQALEDLADANLQLSRLNVLAQRLRAEAEDARRAKEQFVANVSHELRTPLNMIIGFSEMMLGSPDTYGDHVPPPLLADLAVVHRNAEHLKDLIDDVLDLSQIDADQMALTRERVRFAEIVETAVLAVRSLFDSKGLSLETDVPVDLPTVFCDPTRIREVLLNLLSNAGRYTERGGVRVRIRQDGRDLLVSVQDTGPGIAADDLGKLFQPFQQLDGSIRRRYGGTGLGLSISKRFVELHGGTIWVESQPGAGTTFTFRLPSDQQPALATGEFGRWLTPNWEFIQRTAPSKAPRRAVRPRLVLWETRPALQRLVERYWGDAEIVSVANLEAALAALSETPSQALLVNDTSVAAALDRLSLALLPYGVPALVCSALAPSDSTEALGVSGYLVKPVSQAALLAALDRLDMPGKTVLIVDDEPDALQLFRRMLSASGRGYRVVLARDGRQALDVLNEVRPDVILLDLVMPNMDGFQLLGRRADEPALRGIPVIVVSAQDPTGQPVVSSALAVTLRGGLSARQLLVGMRAISQAMTGSAPVDDPAPPAAPPD